MQVLVIAVVALAAWLGACSGARAEANPPDRIVPGALLGAGPGGILGTGEWTARVLAAARPDPVRAQTPAAPQDPAAAGEGEEEEKKEGDWDVIPYTYIWLPWVNAEISSGGGSSSLLIDPSDLLKALNLAYLGGVEFEYRRRWIAGLDINFFDISEDTEVGPVQRALGPVRIERGPAVITVPSLTATVGPLDADVDLKMLIVRGILGYRLLSRPMPGFLGGGGPGDKRLLNFDAFGGGRLWLLRTELDVDGPPITLGATTGKISFPSRPHIMLPGFTIPAESTGRVDVREKETAVWVDPIVGGRVRADLSDRVVLRLAGNIGGFGWGSASKLDWETVITLGYRFKERWTAEGGYRALALVREEGDVQADIIMHGPLVGISYRF